jgi:hypothetical protein
MSLQNPSDFTTSDHDGYIQFDGAIDIPQTVAGTSASATGTALRSAGTALVSSTQAAAYYTLTQPLATPRNTTAAGYRKTIIATAGTTSLTIVINSSGATFDGTNNIATMNTGTTGPTSLDLISLSTTRWYIKGNVGSVVFTTS